MDATLFTAEEMTGYVHEAGLQVEQVAERDPYPFAYQSRRISILGSTGEPHADASTRSAR